MFPATCSTAFVTSTTFTEDSSAVLAMDFMFADICSMALETESVLVEASFAPLASCLLTLESSSAEPASVSEFSWRFLNTDCSLSIKAFKPRAICPNSSLPRSSKRMVKSPPLSIILLSAAIVRVILPKMADMNNSRNTPQATAQEIPSAIILFLFLFVSVCTASRDTA